MADKAVSTYHDPLRTDVELAAQCGLAVQTVRNWRSKRPAFGPKWIKISRAVRYRQSEIDAFLKQGEVQQ